MEYVTSDSEIIVYLQQGDSLIESLTQLAEEKGLSSAFFQGIGAVTDVTLGYYNLQEKRYETKEFNENYELISCLGNIAQKEGTPFVHAHVTMGDRNYNVFGGHLFQAIISVVGEFIVNPIDIKIERTMNENVGLAVWDLERCKYDQKNNH
ncbi:MAG: DNA-binding protein [Candidatus Marinimicrobia bacterium]|nr:DNA-binding protein [Candidatus Neomarinimicrobiota bacterium]